MMRVQIRDEGVVVHLQVCGRLAGCWVPELERCWRDAQATRGNRKLAVDLRGVTFIDPAGECLLESMYREGASFVATGLHTQEIVDHITGGLK